MVAFDSIIYVHIENHFFPFHERFLLHLVQGCNFTSSVAWFLMLKKNGEQFTTIIVLQIEMDGHLERTSWTRSVAFWTFGTDVVNKERYVLDVWNGRREQGALRFGRLERTSLTRSVAFSTDGFTVSSFLSVSWGVAFSLTRLNFPRCCSLSGETGKSSFVAK